VAVEIGVKEKNNEFIVTEGNNIYKLKYSEKLNFYGLTPIGFTYFRLCLPASAGRLHLQAYACSILGGIKKEIISICKRWLSKPYGFRKLQWAYQPIKRKIVIEKLLRDSSGKIPDDYKFSIIHGKCRLIQVYYDRFTGINRAWYTRDWKYIDVEGIIEHAPLKKKPSNLKEMIYLAESLGKYFDFIRVDLYLVDNNIYFGELTNYPLAGKTPFRPISMDFELGSKWNIEPGYWKKQTPHLAYR
jgi:hypothetical protein